MKYYYHVLLFALLIAACSSSLTEPQAPIEMEEEIIPNRSEEAVVSGVSISGNAGSYTFNVELTSPDTGCEQYADWWEVIDEDGKLIHRRVLGHSHVGEQPFVRSGSRINLTADAFVYVRGHMNNSGYGTVVYAGSVTDGFKEAILSADFAKELEDDRPQPPNCAF